MQFKKYTYSTVILERYLDLYGHMNNAVYMELFEDARWDMHTRSGFGYSRVRETGQGVIILEANIKYRKEIRLRETVQIETQVLEYRKVIGRIQQTLLNEAGLEAALAEFRFALFDLKARKMIAASDQWLRSMGGV